MIKRKQKTQKQPEKSDILLTEEWRYFKAHVRKLPEGDLYSFLEISHCAAPSSLMLYPEHSSHLGLWVSLVPYFILYSGCQLGSSLVSPPSTAAWELSRSSKVGLLKGTPCLLPIYHRSPSFVVWCRVLKIVSNCILSIFGCFKGRVNLLLVTVSWLKMKVLTVVLTCKCLSWMRLGPSHELEDITIETI